MIKNKKIISSNEFLSKIGKKELGPGGKKGTKFLYEAIRKKFNNDFFTALVVECNQGHTSIELVKRFNCKVIGISTNRKAIDIAKKNAIENNVEKQAQFFLVDPLKMEFNGKYDVIFTESTLSMQEDKIPFLINYRKYLSDGGILVTHDICYKNKYNESLQKEFAKVAKIIPNPLTIQSWKDLYRENDFILQDYMTGEFTLLSPRGIYKDEGFKNTLKIWVNARKPKNYRQFIKMRKFFFRNYKNLGFIACILQKNPEKRIEYVKQF